MALICKAHRNHGFFYTESLAHQLAKRVASDSQFPVAVYSRGGVFDVYEGVDTIEGFGRCVATYDAAQNA